MIKKIFILIVSIYFFNFTIAQDLNRNKWGCSFAINSVDAQIGTPLQSSWGYATGNFNSFADYTNNSISLSIIPKYYISDDIVLRFEFGITNINLASNYSSLITTIPPETSYLIMQQSIKQKISRYIPGIQWNLLTRKRIDCYLGFTANYLHYSSMNYNNNRATYGLPKDTINSLVTDNMVANGGFAVGIGSFAGFNVHLFKFVSIGTEFSSSLLDYKLGGGFGGVATFQNMPNPATTQTYSFVTSSYKGIQFSQILSSINLTVQF